MHTLIRDKELLEESLIVDGNGKFLLGMERDEGGNFKSGADRLCSSWGLLGTYCVSLIETEIEWIRYNWLCIE